MIEVETTYEFDGWFAALPAGDQKSVALVVRILRDQGVALGTPYSSAIVGASFALRELRPKRGASPLRVLYAFAPRRNALLILGGDKGADKRFYSRGVAQAERLWVAYLSRETP